MRENACPDSIKHLEVWHGDMHATVADCERFAHGAVSQGMHTSLIRYSETLRTLMSDVLTAESN